MVDENKLYKLLVEPCDLDARKHAKALYSEILEALKTSESKTSLDSEEKGRAVCDKSKQGDER